MKTIRGSIAKLRGHWYARVTYYDADGKRRFLTRGAESRTDAIDTRDELVRIMTATRGQAAKRHTFRELVTFYRDQYATAPTYSGDTKVTGLRSWQSVLTRLETLLELFADRPLASITWDDCNAVRLILLSQQTRLKRPRSVTDTNRHMETLRRVLGIAVQKGWIASHPFLRGDSLIMTSSERGRDRVITKAQESSLFELLPAPMYLPLAIAFDCGLRQGEISGLTIGDVDLDSGTLTVVARNSKTGRARTVPITPRVNALIADRIGTHPNPTQKSPLIAVSDLYHPVAEVRDAAGLPGIRYTDFRHTCGTRLAQGGMSLAEIARILGHTNISTTFRYVNADQKTFEKAVEILSGIKVEGPAPVPN